MTPEKTTRGIRMHEKGCTEIHVAMRTQERTIRQKGTNQQGKEDGKKGGRE